MVTPQELYGGHNDVVIVDCALYHHGVREGVAATDFAEALATARTQGDSFVWIGLHDPTEDELGKVAAEFSLHDLAIEDALKAHQRPKVEEYDDSLFVVLKTVRYDEDSPADRARRRDAVRRRLVRGHRPAREGTGARRRAAAARAASRELLDCGPSAVLYAVADTIVDDYTAIALEVEEDIEEVEQQVFSPDRRNSAARIYNLKREVIEFRRAVLPLVEPMAQAGHRGRPARRTSGCSRSSATSPTMRCGSPSRSRASTTCSPRSSTPTSRRSAVQQNEDMRRISAWVAMAAVPTAIAGIYGMNFEHMPELKWRFGYPAVLLLIGGHLPRPVPRLQAQRLALTAARDRLVPVVTRLRAAT